MFCLKAVRSGLRNNFFLIVGIIVGVTLSVFALEILESTCIFTQKLGELANSEHASLVLSDEYEPRINFAGKPLKAAKTPQEFIRPRYYSTELGIREKLFVGVLTSPLTFEPFALPLNKTLNHVVNKLIFFSESDHKPRSHLAGLVQFSDSRLILKPFHMLKYISDNFLDEFDYFFLVKDTTYIHGRKLSAIARSLSVSQDVHIGGGKTDELSNFCSLHAGILLSSHLMRRITSNLDWCVKNAFSDSDDANIGRCILHATDIPCSESAQETKYISHRLVNPDLPIDRILKDSSIKDAVTVWPITQAKMVYQLHLFFSKADLENAETEVNTLRRAILSTTVKLPDNRTEEASWPIGTPPPNKPSNRFDLLRWDYFTESQIYLKTDYSNVQDLQGADLIDIQNVLNASIKHLENKYDGQLIYKRLLNGYRRFDPSRGMDYIVDLAVRDTVTGRESHKRLEICKPLGKVELVPIPYVTENTRVNVVVIATANNQESLLKFIDSYATVCMEKRDKTSLLMLLLYEPDQPGKGAKNDIHSTLKAEAVRQSDRFRRENNKITWLSVKLPQTPPPRGLLLLLLMDLIIKKFSVENLLLLCEPNMDFRQDYLNRVRMNTVRESQVFSPIPFMEYNPLVVYNEDLIRPKELDINKNYGHYDAANAEHISFYVRDYKAARKKIENLLPIAYTDKDLSAKWHQNISKLADSNSLYKLFVLHSPVHVLRAVEPSLRLRHVEDTCLHNPTEHCFDKRTQNLGSRSQLGRLILEYHQEKGATKT